jgi:hypothetical protein
MVASILPPDLEKQGVIWRIGTGENIDVWTDP